ncbi:hypothetical protein Vadar_017801 [Vaccinium darrowii]|uniref:Uncharacterized protein n=1 Tax=Vaccinium darrowii TaxID=229202 RepID=A0ACB7ZDD0_9ERIC|nr:hypothetical protein Vadar_017801 [Vaccinium darrowii]
MATYPLCVIMEPLNMWRVAKRGPKIKGADEEGRDANEEGRDAIIGVTKETTLVLLLLPKVELLFLIIFVFFFINTGDHHKASLSASSDHHRHRERTETDASSNGSFLLKQTTSCSDLSPDHEEIWRIWGKQHCDELPVSCMFRGCTFKDCAIPPEREVEESLGDIVGVYKSLSDCQAQVGSSICDPPVSVYKGYCMPRDTEEYILSCGLKNALYSIRAADLKADLFGDLTPCPFQQPSSSINETVDKDKKRSQELMGAEMWEAKNPLRKHIKLEPGVMNQVQSSGRSCIVEFDGASKGNPGQAGAGAVLRADDGRMICRLREGLGIATCNAAKYRALILGMKHALMRGFTNIRVMGDSKLVCMQIQGLWKVRNPSMSDLYKEAKKLKDRFLSFEISHVLRDLNSDADAEANFAACLADGQIEEIDV